MFRWFENNANVFKDSNRNVAENCAQNCELFQVSSQKCEKKSYHLNLFPNNQNFTFR